MLKAWPLRNVKKRGLYGMFQALLLRSVKSVAFRECLKALPLKNA